jgi:hypothetical protein
MAIKRRASAVWQGGLKDGKGAISTASGALKSHPYGFASRFEGKSRARIRRSCSAPRTPPASRWR